MLHIYGFGPRDADGMRYADETERQSILNEIIYECQRSLEATGYAKLDLETRSWARGAGARVGG